MPKINYLKVFSAPPMFFLIQNCSVLKYFFKKDVEFSLQGKMSGFVKLHLFCRILARPCTMCAMARTKETRVYKLIGRKWTPIMPIMWGGFSYFISN